MEREAGASGELRARGTEGWLVVCLPGSCQPSSLLVGEHSDTPPQDTQIGGSYCLLQRQLPELWVQICCSQVHLIFPFCKMGCMGWCESEKGCKFA